MNKYDEMQKAFSDTAIDVFSRARNLSDISDISLDHENRVIQFTYKDGKRLQAHYPKSEWYADQPIKGDVTKDLLWSMAEDWIKRKHHEETIRTQQATIERLTEQLNVAAEENAKLVSDKYPFAHIRIDCSEYERDLEIKNKLIELGWTPPTEIEASK